MSQISRGFDEVASAIREFVMLDELSKTDDPAERRKRLIDLHSKKDDGRPLKKTKMEEKGCQICMDKRISLVFLCGHGCCDGCAEKLKECPSCRGPVSSKIKLHLD